MSFLRRHPESPAERQALANLDAATFDVAREELEKEGEREKAGWDSGRSCSHAGSAASRSTAFRAIRCRNRSTIPTRPTCAPCTTSCTSTTTPRRLPPSTREHGGRHERCDCSGCGPDRCG